jgi:proteasome accessory factor A
MTCKRKVRLATGRELSGIDIQADYFERVSRFLERRWVMERIVPEKQIQKATREPPQTTRAKLRGEFIRHAKQRRRDYTVDWVHLKLNDQAQRTVLCKDPFRSVAERVEQLIAHI